MASLNLVRQVSSRCRKRQKKGDRSGIRCDNCTIVKGSFIRMCTSIWFGPADGFIAYCVMFVSREAAAPGGRPQGGRAWCRGGGGDVLRCRGGLLFQHWTGIRGDCCRLSRLSQFSLNNMFVWIDIELWNISASAVIVASSLVFHRRLFYFNVEMHNRNACASSLVSHYILYVCIMTIWSQLIIDWTSATCFVSSVVFRIRKQISIVTAPLSFNLEAPFKSSNSSNNNINTR